MSEKGRGLARGLVLSAATLAIVAVGMLTRAQTDGGVDGGADAGGADAGLLGTVLDFHTMTPVSGPFVGSSNPIRGVNGGGAPWILGHADGTLRADGQLEVNVSGLTLTNGANPSTQFIAIVSCETEAADAAVPMQNVSTPPFPATATGNASIRAKVNLPDPCLAPVIFIAGTNNQWFAISGSPAQVSAATDGGAADAGAADAGADAGAADAGADAG